MCSPVTHEIEVKFIRWCVFEVDLGLEVLLLGSLGDCHQVEVLQLLRISKALLMTALSITRTRVSDESPTWSQRPLQLYFRRAVLLFLPSANSCRACPGEVVNVGRDHKRR